MMFRIKIRLVLQCKYIITCIDVVTNKYGEADERRETVRLASFFFVVRHTYTHVHATHVHMQVPINYEERNARVKNN